MPKSQSYFSEDLVIADDYIDKYKSLIGMNNSANARDLKQALTSEVISFIEFTNNKLHDKILATINSFLPEKKFTNKSEVPFPSQIFDKKLLKNYYAKQVNNLFKRIIGEFEDDIAYITELEDEETAFLMRSNTVIRDLLGKKVENNPDSKDELIRINSMIYKIKNNKNLRNKLNEDPSNNFLEYLQDTADYLKNKIDYGTVNKNKEDITGNSKIPFYIITTDQILKLFNLFSNDIIQNISLSDFIKCFDVGTKPHIIPDYATRHKNVMTFALNQIDGITEQVALSHFGISHFYQMKNRPLPKSKRHWDHEIKKIFNKPLKVESI